MSAPAIIHDERRQWLLERRSLITASDAWRILTGEGAFKVWAEKVGAFEPDELTQDYVLFGRDVEGAIAAGYSRKWGRPVRDLGGFTIQRHKDIPWLGATLDRMTAGSEAYPAPAEGEGPAEFKAVGFTKAKDWYVDGPPLPYVIQVQIQMACTGKLWGSLGPLFGGVKLGEPVDLVRDDKFLKAALVKLEAFWLLVQKREAPEADGSEETSDAIRALWPNADGETVELGGEHLRLVTELEGRKQEVSDLGGFVSEIENKLRVALGGATYGKLPDGSYLTLKVTERAGYSVKATSYRTLRRWWPRLLKGRGR